MSRPAGASSIGNLRSMRANKRRDTGPELAVRRELHRRGARYRVDVPLEFDKRRRVDIVFPCEKLAIFIDGCYWHGCAEHYTAPVTNADFWRDKVEGNRARDLDTTSRLEARGWTVLRFWEHQSPNEVAAAVLQARDTLRR